jgi:purine-binding chemotaxis protein CheW
MEDYNKDGQQQSYLSFRLGEEEYAANVSQVLEILEMPSITSIPHSPPYMRGVINLRGRVLPVLDTRLKFGLIVGDDTKNTSIIVLHIMLDGKKVDVGALVDSVEEVMELRDTDMEAPPTLGISFNTAFIKGMVKNRDKFIIVLDMNKVFSESDLTEVTSESLVSETMV